MLPLKFARIHIPNGPSLAIISKAYCIMSISWSWSLCAVQWKNLSRADILCPQASFPSIHQKMAKMSIPCTIPFHHSIPVEHSTDSIPPCGIATNRCPFMASPCIIIGRVLWGEGFFWAHFFQIPLSLFIW